MNEPDIDEVERRLAEVLEKERRGAMVYAILTVALTPVFMAVAALVVTGVASYVFLRHRAAFDLDPMVFYTAVNVFLAYVIVFVLVNSGSRWPQVRLDSMWIAGTAVLLTQLVVTYATPIVQRHPSWLAAGYAVGGILVLGLMGQVSLADRVTIGPNAETGLLAFLLAVTGFILAAYREVGRGSWLWVPPKPDEIRLGAWVLCKLALEMSGPWSDDPAQRRIVDVLRRLKFLQVMGDRLELTPKGLDFVRTPGATVD
jgi:hypothetical protein